MPNDFSWMERAAFIVASGMEVVMLLVLVIGAVRAIKTIAGHVLRRQLLASDVREIWMHFAGWIVLALEFALAADLIETVIAPSWREIGQLAAIAAIRTGLAWFLARDIAGARQTETR